MMSATVALLLFPVSIPFCKNERFLAISFSMIEIVRCTVSVTSTISASDLLKFFASLVFTVFVDLVCASASVEHVRRDLELMNVVQHCPNLVALRQIRFGNVSAFSCVKKPQKKISLGSFVLFLLPPKVQLEVVSQHHELRHKQQTNSCKQHVVLVLLYSWDSSDSSRLWEFLLLRILLLRFLFRHLHEIPH